MLAHTPVPSNIGATAAVGRRAARFGGESGGQATSHAGRRGELDRVVRRRRLIFATQRESWPEWLVGRPLPPAPALPHGAVLIDAFDGSDADSGWIGLRGSTFTSDRSELQTVAFYAVQYPSSQGWRDVAADDSFGGPEINYRCRTRVVTGAGDWESVLLVTETKNPRRVLAMRADVSNEHWPLNGGPPTMEACVDALAWANTSAIDWV